MCALQLSVEARNDRLDAIETRLGASPKFRLYTGAMPANTAAAATGTLLADATLPADPFSAAAGGAKGMLGTWQDLTADGSGLAGYFRFWNSGLTRCDIQGLCGQNWVASTAYIQNQQVINDSGKVYKATTAGTSAGSGGPTGTGSGISDGTAVWAYVGTADMTLDNSNINAGQAFSITAFTLNEPNA